MTPSSSRARAKAAVSCTACSAVCCRLIVILEPEDNIPDHLVTRLPQGHRVMAHGEDGWCIALDRTHMNCSIYESRPAVCRRFFMGGPYCTAIRSEYTKQHSRNIEITLK